MTLDARLPGEPGPGTSQAIAAGEHGRKLRELCQQRLILPLLVAPETRGVLARLTRDLERTGARVLGSSAAAVDLTGDKIRLSCASSIDGDRHAALAAVVPRRRATRVGAIPGRAQAR